jgi:hypothetical protein
MGVLTQEQLAEIAFSVRDFIDNPNNPYILDRRQMPYHGMLQKMKAEKPFINNKLTVKYKSEADELDMQVWYNRDRLAFQEWRIGFDLEHAGVQVHMGLEIVHQELKDQGYIVLPNDARTRDFAAKISKTESLRLIDILKEKWESAYDRWDILIDQKFLHNVSGNPLEPIALTDLISKTPTIGTFGGRSRSDVQLQNPVLLTSTAGSLERDLNYLFRQSQLYSRGFKGGAVNVIQAAGGWIDRYSGALKGTGAIEGFNRQASMTGPTKVDIGIPDTAWAFLGIPVVYNPTMDLMAQLTGDTTWNRRAYGLATKTFTWAHAPKEDKYFSAPIDPADQRISRFSLDGRYSLYCINPRVNFVHEFAA